VANDARDIVFKQLKGTIKQLRSVQSNTDGRMTKMKYDCHSLQSKVAEDVVAQRDTAR